ncbi:MAG TPA: hypothetical protein VKB21_04915 [Candidatus Acidoferrum sp.]|nr:hypothetical protein [Candidatus Acidoferrum sp.]
MANFILMPQTPLVQKLRKPPVVIASALLAGFFLWMIQVRGLPLVPGFATILRIGLPDMMFTYSPSSIYKKLVLFGPGGRTAYRLFLERVDSLFPAIYGLFFLSSTAFCLGCLFPNRTALRQLSLLTLGTTFFDYAENFCFLALLRHYPQEWIGLEKLANVCTLAKWAFAAFSMAVLLYTALRLLFRSLRKRGAESTQ